MYRHFLRVTELLIDHGNGKLLYIIFLATSIFWPVVEKNTESIPGLIYLRLTKVMWFNLKSLDVKMKVISNRILKTE